MKPVARIETYWDSFMEKVVESGTDDLNDHELAHLCFMSGFYAATCIMKKAIAKGFASVECHDTITAMMEDADAFSEQKKREIAADCARLLKEAVDRQAEKN